MIDNQQAIGLAFPEDESTMKWGEGTLEEETEGMKQNE